MVSRSNVFPFRNKEVDARQVGEALRANYILEGSVRKAGNRIRITAQLDQRSRRLPPLGRSASTGRWKTSSTCKTRSRKRSSKL